MTDPKKYADPRSASLAGTYLSGCRVLLFRGRGLMSTLIRWQTRSQYSHAALLAPNGTMIESWQGAGVRVKALPVATSDFQGIEPFGVVGMEAGEWRQAIAWARGQVGCGYDYRGVLRFVSRRKALPDRRWFCSELVYAALALAGNRLLSLGSGEAGIVSPGMLALSPLLVPLPWPEPV
jgi:hypothetical protein